VTNDEALALLTLNARLMLAVLQAEAETQALKAKLAEQQPDPES
jgi:hypothetical protein